VAVGGVGSGRVYGCGTPRLNVSNETLVTDSVGSRAVEASSQIPGDDVLREAAVTRLRKKRDFGMHVLIYLLVNGFLVVIWAVTSGDFFWPIFPIAGWGIGLAANAWDVYGRRPISESEIRQEMDRLRR
jgi:hypothetical protein